MLWNKESAVPMSPAALRIVNDAMAAGLTAIAPDLGDTASAVKLTRDGWVVLMVVCRADVEQPIVYCWGVDGQGPSERDIDTARIREVLRAGARR